MANQPIPNWSKRDNLSKAAHQRVIDSINSLANISSPGAELVQDQFGVNIVPLLGGKFFGKSVKVRVSTAAPAGGVYYGRIMKGSSDTDATAASMGVMEPEGQFETDWDDAIIINLDEDQSAGLAPSPLDGSTSTGTAHGSGNTYTGHIINLPSYEIGVITGQGIDAGGEGGCFVIELPRQVGRLRMGVLTDDGTGSNGTMSGDADYKYIVKDQLTNLRVSPSASVGISPIWTRPRGPLIGPAGYGIYSIVGNVCMLWTTDEQAQIDNCSG